MDGNGMIFVSFYGSFPHSLLSTSKQWGKVNGFPRNIGIYQENCDESNGYKLLLQNNETLLSESSYFCKIQDYYKYIGRYNDKVNGRENLLACITLYIFIHTRLYVYIYIYIFKPVFDSSNIRYFYIELLAPRSAKKTKTQPKLQNERRKHCAFLEPGPHEWYTHVCEWSMWVFHMALKPECPSVSRLCVSSSVQWPCTHVPRYE